MQMPTIDSLDFAMKNHAVSNNATTRDETSVRSLTMSVRPIRTIMGTLISVATVVRTKEPIASLAGFVFIFPNFKIATVITTAISQMSMTRLPLGLQHRDGGSGMRDAVTIVGEGQVGLEVDVHFKKPGKIASFQIGRLPA